MIRLETSLNLGKQTKFISELGLPLTKYHRLGGLNNKHLFAHSSGG